MKKTYAYHKPSAVGVEKIQKVRQAFSDFHEVLEELCPKSRELSVALTHLETTAMWVTKSLVVNDAESVVE